ncbi:MAG TPA: prepilin-type N-terminal cleavage/methylation domain-containing protein [Polyangiaceae bacterium]|nr:prepilin-type N-terminal cleavage/methylation domain-containing protein [Polyangiaceae bacterium]
MSPRARAARGYTAIEVLMAMTVMAIGAAGVMSMQKASVQGNLDARKTDIANSVARTWIERVERDAMQWTVPGPSNPSGASNLASAKVLSDGAANPNKWFLPNEYNAPRGGVALSPGFDILGRDVPSDVLLADSVFCAHVRFAPLDAPGLFRADVRVLWTRGIVKAGDTAGPANPCDATVAASDQPDPLAYHAIYLTTAVKGNPL